MSTGNILTFSRTEVAAGARHFAHIAPGLPDVGRKAVSRAERAAAEAADAAADTDVSGQLDRYAGAAAFSRALAPAHRVQGRMVADPQPETRGYTEADVEALRARIAQDEASQRPDAPLNTRAARSSFSHANMVRDWVHACLQDGSPEARRAGQILAERHGVSLEARV